jgi:hypothetical protein
VRLQIRQDAPLTAPGRQQGVFGSLTSRLALPFTLDTRVEDQPTAIVRSVFEHNVFKLSPNHLNCLCIQATPRAADALVESVSSFLRESSSSITNFFSGTFKGWSNEPRALLHPIIRTCKLYTFFVSFDELHILITGADFGGHLQHMPLQNDIPVLIARVLEYLHGTQGNYPKYIVDSEDFVECPRLTVGW